MFPFFCEVLDLKYRSRIDIIADVLKIAATGAKKTRIMYIANLSHSLLEKYLTDAIKVGFVTAVDGGFETTEKGHSFLEKYSQFSSKYATLTSQLEDMKFEMEILERMCQPNSAQGIRVGADRKNRK